MPAASSVSPSVLSRHKHPAQPCLGRCAPVTHTLCWAFRGTHSHRAELLLASLAQHFTPSCSTSHSSAVLGSISAATPVLCSPCFSSHPGTGSRGGTASQRMRNDSGQVCPAQGGAETLGLTTLGSCLSTKSQPMMPRVQCGLISPAFLVDQIYAYEY